MSDDLTCIYPVGDRCVSNDLTCIYPIVDRCVSDDLTCIYLVGDRCVSDDFTCICPVCERCVRRLNLNLPVMLTGVCPMICTTTRVPGARRRTCRTTGWRPLLAAFVCCWCWSRSSSCYVSTAGRSHGPKLPPASG